jgi:hypothetical protein
MATATLSGPERQKLRQILVPLFSVKQFDMLLTEGLDVDRETITTAEGKDAIVFEVLNDANKKRWLPELVEAARQVRPRDPALYEFAQQYFGLGIRALDASQSALQRMVVATSSLLNVGQWRENLAAIERRVARISYPSAAGTVYGTGFLVGPSAMMTNYHVVELLIDKQVDPRDLNVELDYKLLPNGKSHNVRSVGLADDWCIDSSKYAQADNEIDPATLPTAEELDYAVLRLEEPIGSEPVAQNTSDPDAPPRGTVDLAKAATAVPGPGTSVFIVQHPKGDPLALAMETQGMLTANANQTRLRYQTNTEAGSSGSPVFDQQWNLIALHHSGDPDFSEFHKPAYNQGVPMHLIVELLKKRGKYDALSA